MRLNNDHLAVVARARAFTNYLPVGYCANFVWNCCTSGRWRYGITDAKDAWAKAQHKETQGTPPAGAPVYWNNGRFGHIAVSVGGGKVRSTDYPRPGMVGEVDINALEEHFGMGPGRYLGWSSDFGGDPIPGLEKKIAPKPNPSSGGSPGKAIPRPPRYDFSTHIRIDDEQLRAGESNAQVRAYNARVWSFLYYFDRAWCEANYAAWMREPAAKFGPMTTAATRRMYARLYKGDAKSWSASDAKTATYPGPALLRRLGLKAD